MKLSNDDYKQIYELLDSVSPVQFDCGAICGAACCQPQGDEDMKIYLFPGEAEYLQSCGARLSISYEDTSDAGFPDSWGEKIATASCDGPADCDREHRPLQCRTFPLWPHLDADGKLSLILYDFDLPYACPLIEDEAELSEEFRAHTLEAWDILLQDSRIRELIFSESTERRNNLDNSI